MGVTCVGWSGVVQVDAGTLPRIYLRGLLAAVARPFSTNYGVRDAYRIGPIAKDL